MDNDFKIRVGEFEGPLEILLDLIERRKLHISDVSLSQVADEFIEYTKNFEKFPIADSADFILIAATLLLIKSKSLLPTLDLTAEEQGNIEDLERRLTLHKKFKQLSHNIERLYGHTPLFFADQAKVIYTIFRPTGDLTMANIVLAMNEALDNIPQPQFLPKVTVEKVISLEEMIDSLTSRIQKSIKMSFKDFSRTSDKVTVIVSFLAMLELVKQGVVRVSQSSHFDDIEIESESLTVPQY